MQKQARPFSVSKGNSFTDWWKELDKLETLNSHSLIDEIEHRRLTGLAAKWTTCACGNQCEIIPRNPLGAPEDETLASLGTDFYRQVKHRDAKSARETLERIEKRSALLIQKLTTGHAGTT